MIFVTGDTHGQQSRFLPATEERNWTQNDYIIVCGDFGFLFRNNDAEHQFLNELETRPYTLCFLDGNHENFHAIHQFPVEEWNSGKVHRIRSNIVHLMRGQVFTIEGNTIFTMGGAYSMDRGLREWNISYWNEEIPSEKDYQEAIHNLKQHNNQVDYILTHTAPREMILRMGHRPDEHDIELTGFLEYLLYEIKHKHWYCGHFHMDRDITDRFTVTWFDMLKLGEKAADNQTLYESGEY